MATNTERKNYPLYVALTKREGWWGDMLPYDETILVLMIGMISFMVTKSFLLCFAFTVFTIGGLAYMYARDQDMLVILRLRLILWFSSSSHNTSYWRTTSYSP